MLNDIGGDNLECRKCPYIRDELDRRISWYKDVLYDKIADQEEYYCWCEKIGGKIWQYGICDDAYAQSNVPVHKSKKKRRSKRERDLKHKKHLEYISKNSSGYPAAYPVDKYGNYYWGEDPRCYFWFPEYNQKFAYYKRCYRGNGKRSSSRYHKKMSNRKIRRYKGELPRKGFGSHRLYDYWYEMY